MTLLVLALAWIAGVGAAALGAAFLWPLIGFSGLCFAAGLGLAGRKATAILAIVAVLFAVTAMLRFDATAPRIDGDVTSLNGAGDVVVRGLVTEVDQRERVQMVRLRIDGVRNSDGGWAEMSGNVLLTLRLYPELQYGDTVTVEGALKAPEPFDGFDYRAYLERQGIGSVSAFPAIEVVDTGGGSAGRQALIDIRETLASAIQRSMPEPEASIAAGMLLGLRSSIPSDVYEDFNRSGLSHLIVISGQNMMLVAGLVAGMLWPLVGRRRATVVAIVSVVLYAVLVGGSPPVIRATIMAAVVLGAGLMGREGWSIRSLAIAAALMLLASPRLIEDVSFQLSVSATAGIILGAQRIEALIAAIPTGLFRAGTGRWVAEQLGITSAATLAVVPAMALSIGRVSLVALPANLVAAPMFAPMLVCSLITALVGLVSETLGRMVGQITSLPFAWFSTVAHLFAGVPGAAVEVGFEAGFAAAVVGAVGVFVLSKLLPPPADDEEPPRLRASRTATAAGAVLVLAVAVWVQAGQPAGGLLEVTMLDVGQGDAILIETPDGKVVLVDGGPSGARLLNELGATLPAAIRRIDLVVLTHAQDDHVTGLVELLDRYEVGVVLMSEHPGTTGAFEAWMARLEAHDVPVVTAYRGLTARLGHDIRLEVLHPGDTPLRGDDDANENSVVLKLVHGSVSVLLTGDIGFEAEEHLLRNGLDLRATVLKVGHHGSDGSTSEAFVAAIEPALALISTGAENSYGHPSPTTRLRLAGIPVARTDLNGRVSVQTDGRRIWLGLERGRTELLPVEQGRK